MINQKLFITADTNLPFGDLPTYLRAHQSESVNRMNYELCVRGGLLQRSGRAHDVFMVMDVKPCTHKWGEGGGGGPACSPATKTHVSPGRTGSLPSSTVLGVCSPDLQTVSSSLASPLPAWCSQSCCVSVQEHRTGLWLDILINTLILLMSRLIREVSAHFGLSSVSLIT